MKRNSRNHKACAVLAMCVAAALLWGCGPQVSFTYEAPARRDFSKKASIVPNIPILTVLPDQTCRAEDVRWSQAVADRMTERFMTKPISDRFIFIAPASLRQKIEEAGLQTAFGNPDDAAENIGKIENIDMIIYVRAGTYDSEGRQAVRSERWEEREEGFLYLTEYKIVARIPWKSFDGKDVKHIKGGQGTIMTTELEGAVETWKANGVWEDFLARNFEEFAKDFVDDLITHQVHVKATLAEGTNQAVTSGNSLAIKGDFMVIRGDKG